MKLIWGWLSISILIIETGLNCEKQAKKIDMSNIYEELKILFNFYVSSICSFVFIFALEQEHENLLSTMF